MSGPANTLGPEGVLWLAAIDRVPISERVEWVQTMMERVRQINDARAELAKVAGETTVHLERFRGSVKVRSDAQDGEAS